jgi:hypothetical protein
MILAEEAELHIQSEWMPQRKHRVPEYDVGDAMAGIVGWFGSPSINHCSIFDRGNVQLYLCLVWKGAR